MSKAKWKEVGGDWVIELGGEYVAQVCQATLGRWRWWALGDGGLRGSFDTAVRAAERALVHRGKALIAAGGGK